MNMFSALALPLLAAAMPATAAQIYSAPAGLVGNQQWTGSLGLDFTVNSAVRVSSIGVFDSEANGLSSSLAVTIYNADTGVALFTPVIFNSGTANPAGTAYLFQSITPSTLGPGNYQLTAWGYGTEPNYNNYGPGGPVAFNTLGGSLVATGTRYSSSAGVFATSPDVGTTRYGAGSFIATVPEPAEWALMLGGFGLLGTAMRRRRRTNIVYA